ncbi:MAG: DUF4105 domain-containing protein [Gammaproteobacteria bacterium]|nr:DUF4105 domain-containing protein [Gammaproteobacteria bacterium]
MRFLSLNLFRFFFLMAGVFIHISTLYAVEKTNSIEALFKESRFDEAVKASSSSAHPLNALIMKAREKKLAQAPMWQALGRYQKGLSGVVSQVDDAHFFLSDLGKTDSAKELEATLASFYSPVLIEPTKHISQCRFVARFRWLNEQLDLEAFGIKTEKCEDYELYRSLMKGDTATVIFPASHPNGPSSMFGHTLLRIDKKGQTRATRMLGYSINYAAQVDPNVGSFNYAFRGLSGGFPGKFSVIPYYTKLREYSQMENRDIWEYTLKLSPEELDWVLLYVYEIGPSYFEYYFFTENCSYHLLSLLDVAFPDKPLTDNFTGWTIPVDTLSLLQRRGLISKVTFHPSKAREIRFRRKQLNDAENRLANHIYSNGVVDSAKRELDSLHPERQAKVLDLASDFLRYQKLSLVDKFDDGKLNQAEREILLTRSKLGVKSEALDIPAPDRQPQQGHKTARMRLQGGRVGDNNFLELAWKPAYHSLIDPSEGYSRTAAVGFFNIAARYEQEKGGLQLQHVKLIELTSLEPRDSFFNHFSWNVLLDWQRQALSQLESSGIYGARTGAGLSFDLTESEKWVIYSFFNAKLSASSAYGDGYAASPGLSVGFIAEPFSMWRIHLDAYYFQNVLDKDMIESGLTITQGVALTPTLSLLIEAKKTKFFVKEEELSIGLNWYH